MEGVEAWERLRNGVGNRGGCSRENRDDDDDEVRRAVGVFVTFALLPTCVIFAL